MEKPTICLNNSAGIVRTNSLEQRICLIAIFRQEAKNVKRCLDGVKNIIDYVSICDSGSTDGTPKLIKKWGKKNGIPVKVHNAIFQNFGHNRSLSFDMAKRAFPKADYGLLLDADMVLVVTDKFDKKNLTAGQYLVKQKSFHSEYWNSRLISMKLSWKCIP